MKRVFIHSKIKCENGCKYCFAEWACINQPDLLNDLIDADSSGYIFYPTCDSDLNIDWDLCTNIINKYNDKPIVFSFSSKSIVSDEQIEKIKMLNERINNGFVKLSVGFTTKNHIKELEPSASSYKDRIKILKRLTEQKIETSVVIKPILPFVETNEYLDIVKDTKFVNRYLLGGLYVDLNTSFYKKYINNKFKVEKRNVVWNNTVWDYIEDNDKVKNICDCIIKQGGEYFCSDDALIESIIEKNTKDD